MNGRPATRTGRPRGPVWVFDLDDTLHDASAAVFGPLHRAMRDFIARHLGLDPEAADAWRERAWRRHGATLLGLIREEGVEAADFLRRTHELPGLEACLRCPAAERQALRRLPGRKLVLTNGPAAYARRVLRALGLRGFDRLLSLESMRVFGQWRAKPDRRVFRRLPARLGQAPGRLVMVDDSRAALRAALREGWGGAVWMTGYHRPQAAALRRLRAGLQPEASPGAVRPGQAAPPGCDRISSLQGLRALTFHVGHPDASRR